MSISVTGQYIPFDHVDFVTRLPKPYKKKVMKAIYDTFDHMVNDFRFGVSLPKYLELEVKKWSLFSFKLGLTRFLLIFPAWVVSLFKDNISNENSMKGFEDFSNYRSRVKGSYKELMSRYGASTDISFLSKTSKEIFDI